MVTCAEVASSVGSVASECDQNLGDTLEDFYFRVPLQDLIYFLVEQLFPGMV